MNYLKQYIKLIRKAETRDTLDGVYYEKHHTFPKGVYGNNNRLVKLTYKEHLVAHHLLLKAFRKRYGLDHLKSIKLEQALHAMLTCHSKKRRKFSDNKIKALINRVKNKERYRPTEETKNKISKTMKGRTFTNEHLKNLSASLKGEKNPRYGKPGFFKNKKHTKASKQKMSENLSGEKNPNYGKPRSDSTKAKIAETNRITAKKRKEQGLTKKEPYNVRKFDWINIKTNKILLQKRAEYMINIEKISKSTYHRILRKEQEFCKRTGWKLIDNGNQQASSD